MPKQMKDTPRAARQPRGVPTNEQTPDLGGRPKGTRPPPRGEHRPPYFICTHPERWCVIDDKVVPFVRRLRCTPGANAIDRDDQKRPVMGAAFTELEAQGWTILPWDVDGKGRSYMRAVEGTNMWVDRWTTVYSGATDETFDSKSFAAWLSELIERGVIPACPPYVLARMKTQQQKLVAKLRDEKKAANDARIAKMDAAIAVIDEALESMDLEPAPASESTPASVVT
jgi:hypothetical protein